MSREKETLETIENLKTSMIGTGFKQGELYLLPMLTEIALSLAVIADRMEGKDGDGNG